MLEVDYKSSGKAWMQEARFYITYLNGIAVELNFTFRFKSDILNKAMEKEVAKFAGKGSFCREYQ